MRGALIMAGGQSKRMRSTFGPLHKALVPVLGVPMIERNTIAVLSHGFRHVWIAVNPAEREILAFIRSRLQTIAAHFGATLSVIEEPIPLGTIGAAGLAEIGGDPLLVVNVDNLSTIDLAAMADFHQRSEAVMTVAAHEYAWRAFFGELAIERDRVVRYTEKPEYRATISSGTCVLSQRSRALLESGKPASLPELVTKLLRSGAVVAAYGHREPWIDVNDAAAADEAGALVLKHAVAFECWDPHPSRHVVCLIVRDRDGLAVSQTEHTIDVPTIAIDRDATTSAKTLIESICPQALVSAAAIESVFTFDELLSGGDAARHHVFLLNCELGADADRARLRWWPASDVIRHGATTQRLRRCAAALLCRR
jgi:NDP-sugar pyrophosphorylase family protein